jgi:malate dehydrogenase (oxaloacetate-decarboxylating)
MYVVRTFKPMVLTGASGPPGAFPECVVRAATAAVGRLVILPPSFRASAWPGSPFACDAFRMN